MKIAKFFVSAFFIVALFGVQTFNVARAHADNATTTGAAVPSVADTCVPKTSDLNQIVAIQNDPTLSQDEEIREELALRKKLLRQTITCAENEVQELQDMLKSVSLPNNGAAVKSQLESRLNDAMNFYGIELDKLNGAGIAASEAIAREVLTWRASTFDSLAGQVNNLTLWSQNQNLFIVAQTRMDQTSRAVSFLESATPSNDLQNAFNATRASFNDATQENNDARSAIMQSLPPDQSLALIKQSLQSLSDTYKGFSDVSTIIKSLLPQ